MEVIVDGYSFLKNTPIEGDMLERTGFPDTEGARIYLLDTLADYRKETQYGVRVIFDGWSRGGLSEFKEKYKGVLVLFTKRGESTEAYIKRQLKDPTQEKLIITTEDAIVDFAAEKNTKTMLPMDFYKQIFLKEEAEAEPKAKSKAKATAKKTKPKAKTTAKAKKTTKKK